MFSWRGRSGSLWSTDSQDGAERAQQQELFKIRRMRTPRVITAPSSDSHDVTEMKRTQSIDSSSPPAGGAKRLRGGPVSIDSYGKHVFKGAIAAPYLELVGLKPTTLDSVAWTTNLSADKVAAAMLHWGIGLAPIRRI